MSREMPLMLPVAELREWLVATMTERGLTLPDMYVLLGHDRILRGVMDGDKACIHVDTADEMFLATEWNLGDVWPDRFGPDATWQPPPKTKAKKKPQRQPEKQLSLGGVGA